MEKFRKAISCLGISRIIVMAFLILLIIMMFTLKVDPSITLAGCLVRIGMNGFFGLAMLVSVASGIGLNFGLPIGIVCGLIGGLVSLQFKMGGWGGFFLAIAVSIALSAFAGYFYGHILNRIKGSEMTVSNYIAFSFVSLMSLAWVFLPFTNPELLEPNAGIGLRSVITVEGYYLHLLDNLFAFDIVPGLTVPTGLLLSFAIGCIIIYIFFKTKTGISIKCAGLNPTFAKGIGINYDQTRMVGTIISTVLSAVGIVIYSQSYGFYQLYQAPLMMAYPAIAAILIGGATPKKATIFNVVLGTVMFQSILAIASPVASEMASGSLSEVARVIISNGVILYALMQSTEGAK